MTGLVVGGALAICVGHHHLALGAEDDLFDGVGEVALLDRGVITAGREQRRLVDDQREVGARRARRRGRDAVEVDVGRQRHRAGVDPQNLHAARAVRGLDRDPAVEAPRA
jgi:hypothetical protein